MNDDILINIVANVNGAVNNLNKVSSAIKKMGGDSNDGIAKMKKLSDTLSSASRAMKPVSVVAGGLFAGAFKSAANFEQQMARVASVSGANKKQINKLKKDTIDWASKSVFSVSDVGEAMEDLGTQGYNAKGIIKTMPSALNLAQAGTTSLSNATALLGGTMSAFGDKAGDASHLSDVFAKAADKSRATVKKLGDSFNYTSPIAASLGVSVEDLTSATSLLLDKNIKASTIGTSLRTIMVNLANPSSQAAQLMKELGVSVTDASGNMRPLGDIINDYTSKTKGMNKEQQNANAFLIAGKTGMGAWQALLQTGGDKLNKFSDSLKNSNGYSKKVADRMNNNLGSAFENMKNQVEGLGIALIESTNGPLRIFIDWIGKMAGVMANLPSGELQTIVATLLGLAGLAPTLKILSASVRTISGLITTFKTISKFVGDLVGTVKLARKAWVALDLAFSASGIGLIISLVAALVAGLIYFFTQTKTGKKLWGEFRDYLNQVWQSILATFWETIDYITTGWDETVQAVKDVWSGITDFFSNLWQSIVDTVTSVGQSISDAWSAVVQFFEDLWNGVVEFFVGIWNGIVDTVTTVIQTIQGMWQAFVDFFTGIFQTISDTSSTVWNAIVTFLQPIIDTMTDLWNNFVTTITGIWNGIKETAASVWDLIKTVILGPILLLVDLLTGNWTQMWDDAKMLWGHLKDDVVGIAKGLWDIVKAYVTGLMNDVKIIWDNIVKYAGTAWNNLWKTVTNFAKDVWNDIVNIWKAIPGWVSNLWNNVVSTVSNLWNSIVSGVQNGAKNAWNGLVNVWNSIPGWVSSLWSNVVSTVSGWWSNIVGTVSSYANSAWSSLVNIWNGIPGWVASLWSNVVSTVSSWWNNIVSWVSNGANNAFNSLISVWNGIPGWVSGVWSDVVNTVYDWLGSIDISDLGWNIITGFVNGLKRAWNAGKDFVSGIGKWIRDHKGPISYDRRLLIPAGNAIMNGLHKGLKSSFQPVMNTVGTMAGQIENAMSVSPTVNTSAIQRSINGQIAVAVSGERVQPATFNLQLGGTAFTAFVDDISKQQGRSARLSRTTRLS